MFDNPEKLFILFVIALLIFGPSKLASLGSSLGRSIRDFRNTVRGAQDEFRAAVQEHVGTDPMGIDALAPALPAPEPTDAGLAMPDAENGTAMSTPVTSDAETPYAYESDGAAAPDHEAVNAAAETDDEDLSSLASEPTAARLRDASGSRRGQSVTR